jgi:hypothetical protein
MSEKRYGDFHDALTGETVTRELNPKEILELSHPQELEGEAQ